MEVPDVRFSVFTDSIKRTRWFLLVTTLLSCMLLIHMYLEQFSYQEQQNIDVIKARITEGKVANLKAREKEIQDDIAKKKDDPTKLSASDLDNLATDYATIKYRMKLFDNQMNQVSIPSRQLPLLSMNIPGNDFLPVIGVMLLVFVIAVWLNIRSVLAAIDSLKPSNNEEMRELIRLHFTFTGLVGSSGVERKMVHVVQYASFGLPVLSLLFALGVDWRSAIKAWHHPDLGLVGPAKLFIVQDLILLFVIALLLFFTASIVWKVIRIEKIIDNDTKANYWAGVRSAFYYYITIFLHVICGAEGSSIRKISSTKVDVSKSNKSIQDDSK